MLEKTRGIVLHHIKYTDSSIIIHCYTEKFGRRSLMVSGIHNKKSAAKAALFQPLSLLDMEIYFREKREVHRIKEVRPAVPFSTIPFEIARSSIALFIAELLYKTLKEEKGEPDLFAFLFSSIHFLDIASKGVGSFHLAFLAHYTRFMGFYPEVHHQKGSVYFDMRQAAFVPLKPLHNDFFPPEQAEIFTRFLTLPLSEIDLIKLSASMRYHLLENMIKFYRVQQEGLSEFKTYAVLKEVFH